MTLLLGPPSSGKSTLLKALSGRLHTSGLKYSGKASSALSAQVQPPFLPHLSSLCRAGDSLACALLHAARCCFLW